MDRGRLSEILQVFLLPLLVEWLIIHLNILLYLVLIWLGTLLSLPVALVAKNIHLCLHFWTSFRTKHICL